MLSGCADPPCSNQFRYMHQGRLFLLKGTDNDSEQHVEHLRYAWLCDKCASKLEVTVDSHERVEVRKRENVPSPISTC